MARPKESGISQAFQQKSHAAANKLRRFQAEQLSADMERLFSEELLSDLTVELQFKTLSLHECVIKARSTELYNKLFTLPASCKEKKFVSMKTYTGCEKIENLFRSLYTEDDLTSSLLEFSNILNSGAVETNRISLDTDLNDNFSQGIERKRDILECNEISNDTIGDLQNCDTQGELYNVANEIVSEAIKKAVIIVEKTSPLQNGDICDTRQTEERNCVLDPNVSSEELNGSNMNNGHEHLISNGICKLKSTKDDSEESVTALLEKVYSMKTVVTPCSQLGEDLLRLWLTQTNCDAYIQIGDKTFPVHKCILSCRSMYFGAMLGGSWRESDQEHIVLEGIDTGTMRQTLLYLYGGVVEVDPSCSLGGLVMMSDMYTMEGLKEVVAFNLNKEYCHFFHRPCSTCIVGVPEALTLTMIYNMEAMREKCVKWINKNFGKVWPTKQFAQLPQEVLEFCVSSAVKDLAMDNVIDTMVECRQLNEKIPRLKWSESVLGMTTRLMDASIEFASQKFINIVGSKTFRNIDKQGIAFNKQPLEDIFGMVIMALSPENSCQAYLSLEKWVSMFKAREEEAYPLYSEEFTDFVEFLFKKCKEHLCLYIHQAAHTVEWTYLSKESQKEIMEEANYVCIDSPNKGRMARPQLTSMQKKVSTTSHLSLKEYFDQHFGLKMVEKRSKSPSSSLNTQVRKGKTSNTQARPSTSGSNYKRKGVTPAARKKESSVGLKTDTARNKTSSIENLSQKDKVRGMKVKQSTGNMDKEKPRSKNEGPKEIQTKDKSVKVDSERSECVENVPVSAVKVRLSEVTEGINNVDYNIGDDIQAMSSHIDQIAESGDELESYTRTKFIPCFGQRPTDSVEDHKDNEFLYYDTCQGASIIIERPTPFLEVQFNMPEGLR